MKKVLLLFLLTLCLTVSSGAAAYEFRSATDARGMSYRYIPGDPFAARFYTLSNGMKLYLARNTREPRINTAIAVRAGSADDPLDSTGLAHYFEHMMFKGNDRIASLDWEKERPLLEQIEELFEDYRKESDPERRAGIYQKIDRLSGEAARYSNDEFWTLCQSIGAVGVNAYTSLDETVYICDIPSSSLEKFLYFNAVRFSGIALRRFHTELEAVYEEFNMQQDKDPSMAWHRFLGLMFRKHPYGRSVIGLPEHLKSPSMRDIRTFFRVFYRPDNMALVLSGDLDYEETAALAEKYFGSWKPDDGDGKAPEPFVDRQALVREEPPIESGRTADLAGPQAELLLMGYRFEASPETERMLDMISEILCNGKCGLIDKDILLPQKVLALTAGAVHARDYSLLVFKGTPRKGQSLEQMRDMVFAELEKLSTGDFPDWLPRAVADNIRLSLVTISENRGTAANVFVDSFIRGYPFDEALNSLDLMEGITKQQIMEFARRHLKKDVCTVVLKRTGPATGLVHAEKPPITPVPIPSRPSAFAEKFNAMKPKPEPEPCFPDFAKEMTVSGPEGGRRGRDYRIRNTENERFSLSFVLPAGSLHDLRLPLAFGVASYLGTEDLTLEQLQEELYRLAGNVAFHSDYFTSRITFTGLQRNYDKILDLFHGKLPVLKADEAAWDAYRDSILKDRENAKKDPWSIFSRAYRYAWYGGLDSLSNRYMPEEELKKLSAAELMDLFRSTIGESGDSMDVVYYGPEGSPRLPERSRRPEGSAEKNWEQVFFRASPPRTNGIVFVDYPRVQIIAAVVRPDGIWKEKPFTFERIYDEYARRSFWSEIRERRGLAYMAGAGYSNPTIMTGDWSSSSAYVQTQPDKLVSSIDALLAGLDGPSADPQLFAVSREKILSAIRNARIHPEAFYDQMKEMERRGLTELPGRTVYRELPGLSPDAFVTEWKKRISGKPSTIVIIGDAKKIDFESLKKYGPLTKLTLDQIFRK